MFVETEPRSGVEFEHQPVMLREALEFLQVRRGGLYVDGTCGLGGHARAILEASAPDGRLIAIDRDAAALEISARQLEPFNSRVRLVQENYKNLPLILNNLGVAQLDGILLDLGVSSLQLDDAARGFAFMSDGPLDMRMDQRQKLTAAELVNKLDEKELADLIFRYGEERASRRIARFVVQARERAPLRTTGELAAIVERALRRPGKHASSRHEATRTFQALRIAVNDELHELEELLCHAVGYLRPGARLVVIAFHSLEDRVVKTAFRRLAGRCVCEQPPERCRCERIERVEIVTPRPATPGEAEVDSNPRCRSARLRCVEKLMLK